ncbi:hypothetical protein ERJ75_000137900 [Trypanosoma vivax]|nr:hypothetical protein TRVL_02732 [Trypanosoma vivax]KAH8619724.1 hypothetical protein ERJ75_000137900 [Trypanosoma vivax]
MQRVRSAVCRFNSQWTCATHGAMQTRPFMSGSDITSALPDPPYGLPNSPRFEAERRGAFSKAWLERLPEIKPLARNAVYLPGKEELWRLPAHKGLEKVVEHLPYHDVLRYITEHSLFFLFETLLRARDAPLPHVMYEDFMKCCTFASLQKPPEEQFALPSALLRALLCIAAYQCTLDHNYFTTCQLLFARMEQQQQTTPEVISAWVYCCAASAKVEDAFAYAKYMAERDIPFDMMVFSLMQNPSVNPVMKEARAVSQAAKGLLLQCRLVNRLQTAYAADSVVAHGMFVYYALTLNHVKKWEVIRISAALGIPLAERTLSLSVQVFAREKGLRCGPRTVKALVGFLARDGTASHLLYVLLRARKNELLPEFHGLPQIAFTSEEEEVILQHVTARGEHDKSFAMAYTLIRTLVQGDSPQELFRALTHATRLRGEDEADELTSTSTGDAEPTAVRALSDGVDERSLTAIIRSVRDILEGVDALDRAGRWTRQSTPHSVGSSRLSARRRELDELQQCSVPSNIRVLAERHLAAELTDAERSVRLSTAWVNPDGSL